MRGRGRGASGRADAPSMRCHRLPHEMRWRAGGWLWPGQVTSHSHPQGSSGFPGLPLLRHPHIDVKAASVFPACPGAEAPFLGEERGSGAWDHLIAQGSPEEEGMSGDLGIGEPKSGSPVPREVVPSCLATCTHPPPPHTPHPHKREGVRRLAALPGERLRQESGPEPACLVGPPLPGRRNPRPPSPTPHPRRGHSSRVIRKDGLTRPWETPNSPNAPPSAP